MVPLIINLVYTLYSGYLDVPASFVPSRRSWQVESDVTKMRLGAVGFFFGEEALGWLPTQ